VAYVVAVLPRRESGCRPLAGIDTQPRTLDVLVIDDPLAVAGRDVVAARVVRNFDDFPEELVRLLLARARVSLKKVLLVISRIEFARGSYSCRKTSAMHFKVDVEVRITDVISELARVFGVVGFRLQDAPDHPHHLHLLADPTFR